MFIKHAQKFMETIRALNRGESQSNPIAKYFAGVGASTIIGAAIGLVAETGIKAQEGITLKPSTARESLPISSNRDGLAAGLMFAPLAGTIYARNKLVTAATAAGLAISALKINSNKPKP